MFRPVRQLTIKSLLLLVPLVAGLAAGMLGVIEDNCYDDKTINEFKEAMPLAISFWLLPVGLSFLVRSKPKMFLMSLLGIYAVQYTVNLNYLETPNCVLLAYVWLPMLITDSETVFYLQGVLYALLGPIFAETCHLPEDSPAANQK